MPIKVSSSREKAPIFFFKPMSKADRDALSILIKAFKANSLRSESVAREKSSANELFLRPVIDIFGRDPAATLCAQ